MFIQVKVIRSSSLHIDHATQVEATKLDDPPSASWGGGVKLGSLRWQSTPAVRETRTRETRVLVMIQNDLQNLAHPITELQLLPGNPRRGDIEAVKRSLEAFGQRKPIVVRRSDSVVIAGNHTLQAAQALGWDEIAVVWVDDDEVTSKAFALADNRTAELGDYDEEALADLINDVGSLNPGLLESSGWDDKAVKELLDRVEQIELPTDVDDVPEDVAAVSKLGDIWLLGEHRVMCGDSLILENLSQLMKDKFADMVWTDPPYGVSYQKDLTPEQAKKMRRRTDGLEVMNDSLEGNQLFDFLLKSFTNLLSKCKDGATWFVASPQGGQQHVSFLQAMLDLGIYRETIIWDKGSLVLSRLDYHYQHEPILYGWKPGAAHTPPPDRTQTSIWQIPRPRKSAEHPTMKPIELIVRSITNHNNRGALLLDPFGGSGSTLIAAQETNRVAYLMELDPKYVDVICARYQKVTGVLPVLESSGKVHDFINA